MSLTRHERLVLSNQYRILALLAPKDDRDHWNRCREIVDRGYEHDYRHLGDQIDDDVMSIEESREVLDILAMFEALGRSGKHVSSGLTESERRQLKFHGFDGNAEAKQLAYVRFFCDQDGGRYRELDRGDDFNSHCPMMRSYRGQLDVYRNCDDKQRLSVDDLKAIAMAAVHPSSR